jgi:hypothetical protein
MSQGCSTGVQLGFEPLPTQTSDRFGWSVPESRKCFSSTQRVYIGSDVPKIDVH